MPDHPRPRTLSGGFSLGCKRNKAVRGPPPTQVTVERTPTAAADLDGSGSVGVSDLLSLLTSWSPCPPKADCPADFDGDSLRLTQAVLSQAGSSIVE